MLKEFKENWDLLITLWDTKKGLFAYFFIFLSLYFTYLKKFIEDNFKENFSFLNWIVPILSLIFIYVTWASLSNRLNLFKRKILTTGIFLKCNDSNSEFQIKSIIKDLIQEIQEEFVGIKFKLFPINHITTKAQLDRFVQKNNHIIDNAFFATIYNGNCVENSIISLKIEIQNIFFSANLLNTSDLDFRNNISISHDLTLRNMNKDWQYVESKSFNEKTKIKFNLKDSLLFFNGLHSINMKEYDLALSIFKSLKQSEENDLKLITLKKKQRLNEILLSLFTFYAIEKYIIKKDLITAYSLLKECEIIFKENHRFSFSNYITLSRIYFEKGNLPEAKNYTNKAIQLEKSSAAIYCNLGFFGMIENNPEQVFENYYELAHVYRYINKLNFLEIIDFIELHKSKYPNSLDLFDFAIGALNLLYIDNKLGKYQLSNIQIKLKSNLSYSKIYELTTSLLQNGEIKSPYFHRDKKRKAS